MALARATSRAGQPDLTLYGRYESVAHGAREAQGRMSFDLGPDGCAGRRSLQSPGLPVGCARLAIQAGVFGGFESTPAGATLVRTAMAARRQAARRGRAQVSIAQTEWPEDALARRCDAVSTIPNMSSPMAVKNRIRPMMAIHGVHSLSPALSSW